MTFLQLKAKMDEKRKIQAKKDAEEAKVNEAIRRKGGKDQQQIKQDLQLKEAEKAAIQRKKGKRFLSCSYGLSMCRQANESAHQCTFVRKRADKADEIAARKRIKDQIEADKRARAEKTAREKALREGRNPDAAVEALRNPSASSSTTGTSSSGSTLTPAQAVAASEPTEKKTYDNARLQLRLPSGPPITHNAAGTDSLRSVWEFVKGQTGLENPTLTSSFPR
jgi:hypothetical protein